MPTWAVAVVCSVVIGLGGFMLKYLIRSAGTLGRIETKLDDQARRLNDIEDWQTNHTAEHVADRNAYWDRSAIRRR